MYDLIIIGAGPAGITASVYAARKKMELLVITGDIGGQAALSGDIENYTGYQFITGPELAEKFQQHMDAFNIKINIPEQARDIKKEGKLIRTITDKGEYLSRALIISTGSRPRLLNVEGEKEYKNKGVTYCATCDGPLFKGKTVAIIGGGNSCLDATLQMVKISPKIYIINIASGLTGDAIMIQKVNEFPNVEILNNATLTRIYGDNFVKGIQVQQKGKTIDLRLEGVFIEIGWVPNSDFAKLVGKNKRNEIVVDNLNRTNIEGIFACGDVTDVPEKQIIVACGQGAKAALGAFRYLSTIKF